MKKTSLYPKQTTHLEKMDKYIEKAKFREIEEEKSKLEDKKEEILTIAPMIKRAKIGKTLKISPPNAKKPANL
jgi:hypothetical protein